jgi:L-alanine-DL-glutamate epimerase-like enolase superfamily enzyme
VRVDSVDFFYASMPEVTLEADGSQDALLVRVTGDDGSIGWGECEASPLTSIAAFMTPRSHGVCQPISASVIGQQVKNPADILALSRLVARNSMDLLQAAHTWSGIEIALWDLLGRKLEEPIWKLLGYKKSFAKVPYASMLMGDTPQSTFERARDARAKGFRAVKFGWGNYGTADVKDDADHVAAAREGLGRDAELLIDAGQIWGDNVALAIERIPALQKAGATWLEEPFFAHAFKAYSELAKVSGDVGLAGGEGAHTEHMAMNLIDFGSVKFIQVDAARIGGIGPSQVVAEHAVRNDVTFVNHTFTSHLALSASMQAFVGLENHKICEYPVEPKSVAWDLSVEHIAINSDGEIFAPDSPGLGIQVDEEALRPYLRHVEITIDGRLAYESTAPDAPTKIRVAHSKV